MMMHVAKRLALLLPILLAVGSTSAQLPMMSGDLVFGLNNGDGLLTMEIVRGPANGTGTVVADPWDPGTFIQSVTFDNYEGVMHNVAGNLLGINFGPSGGTGTIYNFSTTDNSAVVPQTIGDTTGLSFTTRIASLSVSPDNTKIAVNGYDPGNVIVYDYVAGDTAGGGASLSNARETSAILVPTDTQGTAWLDSNTVVAFDSFGSIWTVNATTMATNFETAITTPAVGSDTTTLLYNPEISPYLWAGYSGFDGNASTSELYVLDPNSNFSLVNTVALSTSGESIREMAFDADGNLFYSTFGSEIEVLLGAAADPAGIMDNSGVDWYSSDTFASFSGIDIGLGDTGNPGIDCDFNDDTLCDGTDIDMLTMDIANGTNDVANLDLNGDGSVTYDDVTQWLADAGAMNLVSQNSYLVGDANLDGNVDGQDFVDWNTNKFTTSGQWTKGDFNADGPTDGQDFVLWNTNKFMSADGFSAVPEPSSSLLAIMMGICLSFVRRR